MVPGLRNYLTVESHEGVFARHFAACSGQDLLNQLLYVDAKTFLPGLNLAYSDRLSMAASMEVRVPFLDNSIVEFLQHVPPQMKLRGFTGKRLLRTAMKGMLPAGVIHRRKAGFGLPVRAWLRNELREVVSDLLSHSRVSARGLFDPTVIEHIREENLRGSHDYTLQIWTLLTLEHWQQIYMDHDHALAPEELAVSR